MQERLKAKEKSQSGVINDVQLFFVKKKIQGFTRGMPYNTIKVSGNHYELVSCNTENS